MSPTQMPNDPKLESVVLVDQLPSDAWAEGIAIRPSGQLLITRCDGAELYSVDSPLTSADPDAIQPKILHSFPDCNSVLNICALTGTEGEDYAVLTSHAEFATQTIADTTIWRLSFPRDDSNAPPTTSKIAVLPDVGFLFGMISISDNVLAIADTSTPCIQRVHIPTGEVSILYQDLQIMRARTQEEWFGVNRVRVVGDYIWFTNTSTGVLSRAPIEWTDRRNDIRVIGGSQQIATGLDHADGLIMLRDGSAAYVSNFVDGFLWRVDIDASTGSATTTTLFQNLLTPTAMDLSYPTGSGKPTLLVVCNGATSDSFLEGDRGNALTLANVDKSKLRVEVTITTEFTLSYENAS